MNSTEQRFLTRETASVEIYGHNRPFTSDLKNISQTGACIEWFDDGVALSKGDLIRLVVNLESLGRSHNVSAEVVWTDGKKSGVQFIKAEQVFDKMMERM